MCLNMRKFYSEVDLFCTHVGEAHPKRRRRHARVTAHWRRSFITLVGALVPAALLRPLKGEAPEAGYCGRAVSMVWCRAAGNARFICGPISGRSPIHRRASYGESVTVPDLVRQCLPYACCCLQMQQRLSFASCAHNSATLP